MISYTVNIKDVAWFLFAYTHSPIKGSCIHRIAIRLRNKKAKKKKQINRNFLTKPSQLAVLFVQVGSWSYKKYKIWNLCNKMFSSNIRSFENSYHDCLINSCFPIFLFFISLFCMLTLLQLRAYRKINSAIGYVTLYHSENCITGVLVWVVMNETVRTLGSINHQHRREQSSEKKTNGS